MRRRSCRAFISRLMSTRGAGNACWYRAPRLFERRRVWRARGGAAVAHTRCARTCLYVARRQPCRLRRRGKYSTRCPISATMQAIDANVAALQDGIIRRRRGGQRVVSAISRACHHDSPALKEQVSQIITSRAAPSHAGRRGNDRRMETRSQLRSQRLSRTHRPVVRSARA